MIQLQIQINQLILTIQQDQKWTPELIKELEDGRKEEVKRTIKYVYADGTKAADSVQETKEFKRSATINPVTGKITFGDWSPAQTFEAVNSPEIKNYTPNKATVPASEVTATAEDINETVVYTTKPVPLDPTNQQIQTHQMLLLNLKTKYQTIQKDVLTKN